MEWEGKPSLLEEGRGRGGYSGGSSSSGRKEGYSLFAASRTQYSKHMKKLSMAREDA